MPKKIVITGAAGLVGQNLIPKLKASHADEIIALDKHHGNAGILSKLHPEISVIQADLALAGSWQHQLAGCTHLVIGHAQIGGTRSDEFVRNNIVATERLLEAAIQYHVPYIVSISSSVVNSKAIDDYTETKKAQEALIAASNISQIVLRPTLMFGWFDRKHLGWLARFMKRTPIFPIPGDGKFLRQPLFAGDFASILKAAIERQLTGSFNITGQTRINYIDLIRLVKRATGSKTQILNVPYSIFSLLLKANALFDQNPAFTNKQLEALVTPDIFEVIDWPSIFGVDSTPLQKALNIAYSDPIYSHVVLEF